MGNSGSFPLKTNQHFFFISVCAFLIDIAELLTAKGSAMYDYILSFKSITHSGDLLRRKCYRCTFIKSNDTVLKHSGNGKKILQWKLVHEGRAVDTVPTNCVVNVSFRCQVRIPFEKWIFTAFWAEFKNVFSHYYLSAVIPFELMGWIWGGVIGATWCVQFVRHCTCFIVS
jgi:hypothetical protein